MYIKIDKICKSSWSQFRGLMFSRPKRLLFVFNRERQIAIHTWFVFFPITLVFLNKSKQVTEIKGMKPWTIYRSKTAAAYMIEMPNKNQEFSVGQTIKIN